MNFLDIPTLMRLAELLTPRYTVVYIRPGFRHQVVAPGYATDGSEVSHELPSGFRHCFCEVLLCLALAVPTLL